MANNNEEYSVVDQGDRRVVIASQSSWEKHAQTILAGAVLLVMSWVGMSVNNNGRDNAVMASQIADLKGQVTGLAKTLNVNLNDRYRGRDAQRDFQAVYKSIERIEDANTKFMNEQSSRGPRIGALETHIINMEKEIRSMRSNTK